MNYRKERKTENLLYDTPVENLFIAEFLPEASGDAVKVYLLGLMYAGLGRGISNARIAKSLRIDEAAVDAAWAYWESKGILRRVYPDPADKTAYDIEYGRLKETLYGRKNASLRNGEEPEPAADAAPEEAEKGTLTDESIHAMFIAIEAILGEPVNDVMAIFGWLDKYGATPETVVEAFRFAAVSRKNTRTSYVEAIVREWAEKGLLSAEAIHNHLEAHDARHTLYRRVLRALGLYRNATEEEERLMDSWFDELGFDIDKVLEACGKTAGISNPNIKYINSVLRGWYRDLHGRDAARPADGGGADASGITAAYVRNRMAEYARLREAEETDAEKRRNAVYARLPRIREIDGELHALSMRVTRLALGGTGLGGNLALRGEMERLEKEKTALLREAGLTEADLNIRYTCEKCRDTGYLEDGSRCSCFVRAND